MNKKLFQWTAYNQLGKKVKGLKPAASSKWLKVELLNKNLYKPKCQRVYLTPLSRHHLKLTDITTLLQQLAVAFNAGIPIVQALTYIRATTKKLLLVWLIQEIHHKIENGYSIHQAFSQHANFFSATEVQMIAMAELTGTLDKTLQQIVDQRQTSVKIKTKIRKALTYPSIVMSIGVIVTLVMLILVVPKFAQLYNTFNAQLPWLTQEMLNIAQAIQSYGPSLALFFIVGIGSLILSYRHSKKLKYHCDRLIFKTPILGSLLQQAYLALWAQTLSTLLSSGIPLLQALEAIENLVQNQLYQMTINQTKQAIQAGQSLYYSLENQTFFTRDITQIIAMGEQTGQLDQMLQNIADSLSYKVSQSVDQLSSLLEPLTMVIIGVIVGILVIAMYLPIFEMGNVI